MFRTALTLVMSSLAIPAVASMRCGTHLVDEGDSVEQVLERCGQPLSRIVNEPALRNNGVPKLKCRTHRILGVWPQWRRLPTLALHRWQAGRDSARAEVIRGC